MTETVRLHDLSPSPNNIKVRLGLAYKGITYESCPIAFDDFGRSKLVELSGQPLSPVLEHGDRVVFDSSAILRYLDANFRSGPRLFAETREKVYEIEEWERYARRDLGEPISMTFGQAFAPETDTEVLERACQLLNAGTERIEERLKASPWLVGDSMTAADLIAAPCVLYGMLPDSWIETFPFTAFFKENLKLGEGRGLTRAWVERCMALDPVWSDAGDA